MDVFAIAPAATRTLWLVAAIPLLALLLVACVVGRSLLAARSATFEVSTDGLQLKGDWYGRFIPASHLMAGAARVDLSGASEMAPRRRTLGTGLPGYRAGWFRLRNGDRALLYVTDNDKAVRVPTTDGFSVIVTPSQPDRFVAAVNAVASAP